MSPTSDGGSSRHSPASQNDDKDVSIETLQEETRRTGNTEDVDVHPNFQFCTLPRKKKSVNGGK